MKLSFSFLIIIVIQLTTGSVFQHQFRPLMREKLRPQKCYTPMAACVPIEFCPRINEALNQHINSRTHRGKLPHDVTCRQCRKDDDQQISVLCEPGDLTKGRDCVTSQNVAGQCIPEEYCKHHLTVANGYDKWNGNKHQQLQKEKTCFEEDTTNYYCCPWQFNSEVPIQDGSIENVYSKCRDSRRLLGHCVPVRQCDNLDNILANMESNKHREKFMSDNLCPSDDLTGRGHSICCATTSSGYSRNSWDWIRHPKAARLGLEKCGLLSMVNNIYRGEEAGLGHFPWMVNLLYRKGNKYVVMGAGTLIHPKYVLTAAHTINKNLKKVRVGEYDLGQDEDCDDEGCAEPALEYPIRRKISHEKFNINYASSEFDIGLLELYHNVKLIENQIYPICLPLTETLLMLKPRRMTITGWGWSDRHTSVLLKSELEVVSRQKHFCPEESTFCARDENWSGHCKGDSGGPYQTIVPVGNHSRYVQFGVISAGSKDCTGTQYLPNVGVGVAYYINWILDHMNV